jgi:hypothetical protein
VRSTSTPSSCALDLGRIQADVNVRRWSSSKHRRLVRAGRGEEDAELSRCVASLLSPPSWKEADPHVSRRCLLDLFHHRTPPPTPLVSAPDHAFSTTGALQAPSPPPPASSAITASPVPPSKRTSSPPASPSAPSALPKSSPPKQKKTREKSGRRRNGRGRRLRRVTRRNGRMRVGRKRRMRGGTSGRGRR